MKKTILTLLLAAMSTGAMAEWVRFGSNDERVVYADPSTIRRNGNIAKMWSMHDLTVQSGKPNERHRSLKALDEFDCAGERYRNLALLFYSGQMADGKVVSSFNYSGSPGDWQHVVPETGSEYGFKIACGKTKLPK